MKVLVACERSGVVRDAFLKRGHDAVSCDLEDSRSPGPHIKADARTLLQNGQWDLVIAHPPCTALSKASGGYYTLKHPERVAAAGQFFRAFLEANAERVCVENPTPHYLGRKWMGQASCVVEPWHHGHPYTKRTLLWLRGLPPLMPTCIVEPVLPWYDKSRACATNNREKAARTFTGIARAMAEQWG